MGLDADHQLGLAIATSLFLAVTVGIGVYVNWLGRRQAAASDQPMDESHYLAKRSLGSVVTTMTLFASLFSGYTTIGLVDEAYRTGFVATRWWGASLAVPFGQLLVMPRLREVGIERRHMTPLDFVTDRFRSRALSSAILVLQIAPSSMYLAGQLAALKSTANLIFGLPPEDVGVTIGVAALMLLYESLGGLKSVAWTDAVQGGIMIVSVVLLPSVVASLYGGYAAADFPSPAFYQTPSLEVQFTNIWCFILTTASFFTLPHMITRSYAACDTRALRFGYSFMSLGAWLVNTASIAVGVMAVVVLQSSGAGSSPFTSITEAVMDSSGLGYVAGLVAWVSAFAATMSTADSVQLAVTQLLVAEVALPLSEAHAGSRDLVASLGPSALHKLCSVLSMGFALLVALTWTDSLSYLAAMQFAMSFQAVPTFLLGLYSPNPPHPWALACGGAGGFVALLCVVLVYNNDLQPAEEGHRGFAIDAGMVGMLVNIALISLVELACRAARIDRQHLPAYDVRAGADKFGALPLSHDAMARIMSGAVEPCYLRWFAPVWLLLSVLSLPLGGAGSPPLTSDGSLAYEVWTAGGLPAWTVRFALAIGAMTLVQLLAVWAWRPPAARGGDAAQAALDMH